MTEKRFRISQGYTDRFCHDWQNNQLLNFRETIELLNEQHETIERLKDNCKVLDEVKCEIAEENEQLKQRINVLDDQITAQGIVIEGYQNRNQKLFDENEQLKSENKKLNERIGILEGSLIDKGFDIND